MPVTAARTRRRASASPLVGLAVWLYATVAAAEFPVLERCPTLELLQTQVSVDAPGILTRASLGKRLDDFDAYQIQITDSSGTQLSWQAEGWPPSLEFVVLNNSESFTPGHYNVSYLDWGDAIYELGRSDGLCADQPATRIVKAVEVIAAPPPIFDLGRVAAYRGECVEDDGVPAGLAIEVTWTSSAEVLANPVLYWWQVAYDPAQPKVLGPSWPVQISGQASTAYVPPRCSAAATSRATVSLLAVDMRTLIPLPTLQLAVDPCIPCPKPAPSPPEGGQLTVVFTPNNDAGCSVHCRPMPWSTGSLMGLAAVVLAAARRRVSAQRPIPRQLAKKSARRSHSSPS